ncbi:MAG: ABC transporter substrate-binding protein, partial [Anaerolineae bacterium]
EREVTKIVEGTPQVVKETVVVEKVVTVEGPVAEQITVKVSGWGDVLGKTELLEQTFFTSFKEAYPNVTIQYEPAPWNEYWTKLHAMAASGDIYDLFAMSVAYGWDFANKKITLNLQPYIDTEINTDEYFMEMELNCHRYPNMQTGDLYAFPIRWVGASLFYNVDMFDEVGLAYPDDKWTYDDMLTAAQALTKVSGDKTERWGMMAPAGHVALDAMIKANGGEVVSKDYRKCMLTEPAAVESIQWAVDCIQKHNVAPTPAAAAGFAEGTFASKVVGMVIDGSYMMNPWEQAEFNWDVSWIPNGKVSRVMYGGPDSLSIARLTKAREAAWALLKHWVSEEQQMIMDIFPPGSVPFLRKAAYSDKWLGRGNMPKGAKTVLDMAPVLRGADFGSQWMEWRVTIMNQELDLAYLGERSVEESVQAACAGIDQVLANIEWPV